VPLSSLTSLLQSQQAAGISVMPTAAQAALNPAAGTFSAWLLQSTGGIKNETLLIGGGIFAAAMLVIVLVKKRR
jgi:LPXTG-motif cell wall-anchored protein